MFKSNFQIIVSIAKIDNNNNKNNANKSGIDVVCSVVNYGISDDIDLNSVVKTSKFLYKNSSFFHKNRFTILNFGVRTDKESQILYKDSNINIIYINIFEFMKSVSENVDFLRIYFAENIKNKNINRYEVVGKTSELYLHDNMRYNNIIITFDGITWSNIRFLFKLCGITIYGGSSSKRHLLSTVQKSLVMYLQLLNNMSIDPAIVYKSYMNNNELSNKYDKNLIYNLREYGENILKLIEYKTTTFEQMDFYILINTLLNAVFEIKSLQNRIRECEFKIKTLNNNIKIDKEKLEVHLKSSVCKNTIKKIKNCRLRLEKDNKELISLKSEIENKQGEVQALCKNLYRVDHTLFTESGEYIYDEEIKIDLNDSTLIKLDSHDEYENERIFVRMGKIISNINNNNLSQKREYSTVLQNIDHKDLKIPPKPITSNENDDKLYFEFLDEILKEFSNDPIKGQEKIENEWSEYMVNKLSTGESKIRRSITSILKYATKTLELQKCNGKFKKKFPLFNENLNKDHLLITLSTIITYHSRLGFTSIAMIISRNIIINIYIKLLKSKKLDDNISLKEYISIIKMDDDANRLILGSYFIEIFCQYPIDVFEKNYKNSNMLDDEIDNTPISVLDINEAFLKSIGSNFIIPPMSLPMICKPNIWSDKQYGGYLNNRIIKNELITKTNIHSHQMEYKDILYKSVNYLNSVKFKININLINYLENEGRVILDNYLQRLNNKSEKLHFNITFKIAKCFSKLNIPFYINHNADWRGRLYTQSFFISYQSGDFGNSLINFYDGEKITENGLKYLYIHGANCHNENNISKKSINDRIDWVRNNLNKIINLDIDFILKADSLFLFLSFCLSMREIHVNKNDMLYLPVFLDATCSGIQHLAGILKDYDIGKKVNLIPQNENDNVMDIYSELLGPINEAINNYDLKANVGEGDCNKFKDIKLRREHVKLPIMTKNYNVSLIGIADQLRSSFKKVNKESYLVPTKDSFVSLNYYQVFILAQIIEEQIFKTLPSLKNIYDYFKNIIKLCSNFNLPAVWFTPSGVKITQYYNISEQNKVSIKFGKKVNKVVLKNRTEVLDKRKQVNAIIPNIIHSLDASHLMNIINTAISINMNNVLPIHDCFGTHPNNLDKLTSIVKKEFILLYTNSNFLELYHQRFIQALIDNNFIVLKDDDGKLYVKPLRKKIYLPELPKMGTLELEKINNSIYFMT